MLVLIDSNILFDVLQNREPHVEESTAFLDLFRSENDLPGTGPV